ncbi:MAG TPA: nuclear transport factor 2 family protein [Solirubrobacteraceae bacterium]|nr:nuclear transport factor 2 family protein [Solirubrobacteraceae bacterium]
MGSSLHRGVIGAGVALALSVALAACGETASTSGFKGESHSVAQTISNFQTDVSAREQKKLCERDLAAAVTGRLTRSGGSCQAALKNQLLQIDATSLTIETITVNGKKATARVKSTYSGKTAISALTLVNEGGHWKISGTTPIHVSAAPKKG